MFWLISYPFSSHLHPPASQLASHAKTLFSFSFLLQSTPTYPALLFFSLTSPLLRTTHIFSASLSWLLPLLRTVLLVSSGLVRMCRSTSSLLRIRRFRSVWRSSSRRCQEELRPSWRWSSTTSSISPMLVWTHTFTHSTVVYIFICNTATETFLRMVDRNTLI